MGRKKEVKVKLDTGINKTYTLNEASKELGIDRRTLKKECLKQNVGAYNNKRYYLTLGDLEFLSLILKHQSY